MVLDPAYFALVYSSVSEGLLLNAITRALSQANGNKAGADDLLGIARSTLYRKMRQYRHRSRSLHVLTEASRAGYRRSDQSPV
jgi:DNA-binding NtrC family response regulator